MKSSRRTNDYIVSGGFDDIEYYRQMEEKKRLEAEKAKQAETQKLEQERLELKEYLATLPKGMGLYFEGLSPNERSAITWWKKENIPITQVHRFKTFKQKETLFINESQQRWSYAGGPFPISKIYRFSDIVDCHIQEDFEQALEQEVSGKIGGALAGGLLFGETGAIIGSAGKRNVSGSFKQICKSLSVQITLAIPESPVYITKFLFSPSTKESINYKAAKDDANKLVGVFLSLKAQAKNNNPKQSTDTTNEPDFEEILEKLFRLKQKGIITEEEFTAKKRQVLGI